MKKLLTIIISVLFLLSPNISKASHFVGADLTYTCLGGSNYLVTYTFYRDCSGVVAPGSVTIFFYCGSNSANNFSMTLIKIPGTGQEITNSCSSISTKCSNGNAYGIQEYIYQAHVTLATCSNWRFEYSACCRNPISTVQGSTSSGWFNKATLNNQLAPGNSSPIFSSKPVFIAYKNQPLCIDLGALDVDGDSLVYSLSPSKKSSTANLTYQSPYSYTNFLQAQSPGITLNSSTGQLCFTPTTIQTTVYCVKVEEYRTINGTPTLIGTIYRDIQLKIIQGNNHTPVLSGLDTSLSKSYSPNDTIFNIQECLSSNPLVFNIYGFDADTFNPSNSGHPEEYSISWNNGIPNGTLSPHFNGTDSAYATFSWTPSTNDVNVTRCFTASIMDKACPYNALQSFTYCMLIKGMLVDIGSDTMICKGESIKIKANASPSTVNYLWSIDGNSVGIPTSQDSLIFNSNLYSPGQHTVSIETNDGSTTVGCPGVDQIVVNVTYQPHINGILNDTTICIPQTVTYDAGQGQQYLWTNIMNTPLSNNQTLTINAGGIYIVNVNGGLNTRCYDVDTFIVSAFISPPAFSLGPDVTIGQAQTLVLSIPNTPSAQYLWSTGDTTRSITIDSSYNWINRIIGSSTFGNQCYSSDTIYVYIGSVGMEEDNDSPLRIYPNPVQNYLNIELQKDYPESNIEILDLNGKLISKTKFSGASYKLKSLDALPKGVYILHLQNEELNVLLRFVKE